LNLASEQSAGWPVGSQDSDFVVGGIAMKAATDVRRKLIEFDEATWQALDLLARDSLKSWQELADEAFRDLLKKHGRPTDLRGALKQSMTRVGRGKPQPSQPLRQKRAKGRT
jgi:hypothetical protein